MEWHFDDGVPGPGSSFRDRVKDGALEWNAENTSMSFDWDSGDISNIDYLDCPSQLHRDVVFHDPIDGALGILAVTRSCAFNGDNTRMKTFNIMFDSQEDWYTGTGTPARPDDAWGIATHEFGHATGFGLADAATHFASSDCNVSPVETMCPEASSGYIWRSLEPHDTHTFDDRY